MLYDVFQTMCAVNTSKIPVVETHSLQQRNSVPPFRGRCIYAVERKFENGMQFPRVWDRILIPSREQAVRASRDSVLTN